jgi:hypothetical protein
MLWIAQPERVAYRRQYLFRVCGFALGLFLTALLVVGCGGIKASLAYERISTAGTTTHIGSLEVPGPIEFRIKCCFSNEGSTTWQHARIKKPSYGNYSDPIGESIAPGGTWCANVPVSGHLGNYEVHLYVYDAEGQQVAHKSWIIPGALGGGGG